jgi:hypothetical protein
MLAFATPWNLLNYFRAVGAGYPVMLQGGAKERTSHRLSSRRSVPRVEEHVSQPVRSRVAGMSNPRILYQRPQRWISQTLRFADSIRGILRLRLPHYALFHCRARLPSTKHARGPVEGPW